MYKKTIFISIKFTTFFQKLQGLKPQDKTQITMIVIWVVELFMNQLGNLRSNDTSYLQNPKYMELQKQFDSFLATDKVEVSFIEMSDFTIFNFRRLKKKKKKKNCTFK